MRYYRVYLKHPSSGYLCEFVIIADSRNESAIGPDGEMYWLFKRDGAVIVSIESVQVHKIREEYVA